MARRFIFNHPKVVYDVDAQNYFTAGNITNPAVCVPINTFYVDAKSLGIYNKITAFYIFWQGTSLTPKLNGVDPRDLDIAHRITYYVSPVITPNGIDCTAGGAMLNIIPNVDLTLNDSHFSFYSQTNANGVLYDFYSAGCIQIFSRISDLFLSDSYNLTGGAGRVLGANTSSEGFFVASRLNAPTHTIYKNGVVVATNSTTDGALVPDMLYLGSNDSIGYSTREYSFASVGLGLTSTEVADLNTLVSNLNTALGR